MNMFSSNARTRQPRYGRSSKYALSPRRRNNDLDREYAYPGQYQPSDVLIDLPLTPPPTYEDSFANKYTTTMPPPTLYQQLLPLQQDSPVSKDNRFRKKTSTWVPMKELAREAQEPSRSIYGQEQGRQGGGNLVSKSIRSQFDDSPIVDTLVQSAAICDRVTAMVNEALHEALSLLDCEENDQDDLIEATKGMSVRAHPLERTRGGSIIDFKKTWMYSNSRLPPHMPPVKLYLATWQLVCSAALASTDVYRRPRKDEKQDYIDADWRAGTKAMTVKSSAVDDKNLIVIAIRGSKWNVMDWAVNFHPAPTEPYGFLEDEGNACHAGFLRVARSMVSPIAARLRHLLEQDPSRASSSLLFTGHSAGGAVASLLYMHMMASTVESKLHTLTGCFKRVHCITFGTPPLSFLPLSNPGGKRFERNTFMSFVSEGDPVVRADRQYLSTLTRIIAAPSQLSSSRATRSLNQCVSRQTQKIGEQNAERIVPLRWDVPPATLSNAGRLVLLREKPGNHGTFEAVAVTDAELRDVVFGDPEMHHMELYKRRVNDLAITAVTGRPI